MPVVTALRRGVLSGACHADVVGARGVRSGRQNHRINQHEPRKPPRQQRRRLNDAMTAHRMSGRNDGAQIEHFHERREIRAKRIPTVGRLLVAAAVSAHIHRNDVPGQMRNALIPAPGVEPGRMDKQRRWPARLARAPFEIAQRRPVDADPPFAWICHASSEHAPARHASASPTPSMSEMESDAS